ncbi:flagellar filament capping protein FliD [Vibrio astriarenae]
MNVDAAQLASNFASYDIQPFELRYTQKLSTIASQTSAVSKVKSSLQKLEDTIYEFTKAGSGLQQTSVETSSDDYFSLSSSNTSVEANLDIFVKQLASNHQVMIDARSTDPDDVMFSEGSVSITHNSITTTIDVMDADSDMSGDVSYTEFVTYFNDRLDGSLQATLIKSQGAMKVLFSSEEEGADQSFELTADSDSGWQSDVTAANAAPLQVAQDAIIQLGGEGGSELTSSTNQFSTLFDGIDLTVKQANQTGDSATSIKIGEDFGATVDALQDFINTYNSSVSEINNLTRSGGEDELRGVLASDSTIRTIKSQLQGIIRSEFDGTRLFDLGIELDRDGKLSLDREVFEEASNSINMDELFVGSNGVFEAFENTLDLYLDYTDGSLSRRIETLNDEKSRINEALSQLDARYETYYNRYLAQFTQLNALNSELESVSALFVI